MAKIYRIHEDSVIRMDEVLCENEEVELQNLLERSPELLAGEQIDPDHPRKWLLIKREMSVPDPVTGSSRWSIDFLYIDQDAILTFVECKRHNDTRSRREVIGQVFDYAANAPRLWESGQLRQLAEETQGRLGRTLKEEVGRLGSDVSTPSELFDRATANLREHKLRIVLFLETAPPELKTLVEFLMDVLVLSKVEIVLVEARRYRHSGLDVIAPTVWGYTEQVRTQRRVVADALSGVRRRWDEGSFFAQLNDRLPEGIGRRAVERLYCELPQLGYQMTWGTGQAATLNIRLPGVIEQALLTVTAEGDLIANYGAFGQSPDAVAKRDALARSLEAVLHKSRPKNFPNCWPRIKNDEWASYAREVVRSLQDLAEVKELEPGAVL
jgi:hypothetical protein